jgi:hypothetical protein
MTWTMLIAANDASRPSARTGHGFTSAGGMLYVHGGEGIEGGSYLSPPPPSSVWGTRLRNLR